MYKRTPVKRRHLKLLLVRLKRNKTKYEKKKFEFIPHKPARD
jgi:hypothetical protein